MKRMYDWTFGGYYVMSVILGLLLAVAIGLALDVGVDSAMLAGVFDSRAVSPEMMERLDWLWGYLPLRALDMSGGILGVWYSSMAMVVTSILTVGMFVRMAGGKNSRTKILQAVSVMMLVLFILMAFTIAMYSVRSNPVLALVPVLLMVIPFTILKKTQMPCETAMPEWMEDVGRFLQKWLGALVFLLIIVVIVVISFRVSGVVMDAVMPGEPYLAS